jgi:hypothetical protein
MQKRGLKILIIGAFALIPLLSYSQLNTNLLAKADSLFQQKRYTQSFEIYKTLFDNQQYSPAMLLKMAYIQEGLERISQAAYYLNLYYVATRDQSAQAKLEELASKYRLEGYESSEIDRVFSLYDQYRNLITVSLASAFIFLFTLAVVQRLRYKTKPFAAWGVLTVVSIILFVHLNLGEPYKQAIITNSNTYLMDGPSAGASVITIVRDGHRVQILGKKDVWVKVSWGESEAYVKESNLIPVKL